ncbi:MAG: DUF4058 family protein [Verrucomicrobia bacterium]|nr:DUF4058 family protein [Verrucomicrobiota bacterium]
MRSPFPGMDPWLELYWRDVHASLIIYIRDQLQRQLPEPLIARAEENVSVDIEDQPPVLVRPDVQVTEDWRTPANGGVAVLAPPVSVAEPLLLRAPEPEVDRHVQIIDPSSGGRVVTAIKVLSPSNKLPGRARTAYEEKQRAFLAAGVNVVEIDLVRKGDWAFSVDEALLPQEKRTPHMVCVFRATRPHLRELYLLPFREPLPCLAIPLRPRDRDVALDLQQVIDEAYERGRYDRTDYRRPLTPPLSSEDAAWADDLLRKAGRL